MTQRTFTGKTGDVWTWEETPEVVAALKKLHNTVVENRVNRHDADIAPAVYLIDASHSSPNFASLSAWIVV